MGSRIDTIIQSESVSYKTAVKRHVIAGFIAGVSLLAIYAGILTLAQGTQHALEQAASLWYWLLALIAGFGIQVGLFSFIRQSLRERHKSLTGGLATSGGVSAGSMVACCVHHLSEALPFLGLAGVAAFLTSYQVIFLILGILSNAVGITFMLDVIQRHHLCPVVSRWRWNMGRVKMVALVLAVAIIIASIFRTLPVV